MIANMFATVAKKCWSVLAKYSSDNIITWQPGQNKTEVFLITIIQYLFFKIIVSK